MQVVYSHDLQKEQADAEVGTGRAQRVGAGLLGVLVFAVIVACGAHPASPTRASAGDVLGYVEASNTGDDNAGDTDGLGGSLRKREEVATQVSAMQAELSAMQKKLDHLQARLNSCGAAHCVHPGQCCHGAACCADGTQCCDSGNCCAAGDICCHGACCSAGGVCCPNGLCGLAGDRCEDGLVLPPAGLNLSRVEEAVGAAITEMQGIKAAETKAATWLDGLSKEK